MATGYYSEVALSLGYKFTYGYENADKYTNFQLGLMALNGYFLAQQSQLVRQSFEDHFEKHITDTNYQYWSSKTYAMEFLMKSAEAGFPPAMLKLADLSQGENIYGNATDWIYKAAAHGHYDAVEAIKAAGKEVPELLISQELANKYTLKGREIEDIFRLHDKYDAAERNRKHQQQVQERIALIKNVVIAAAAIAVAGHVISETNHSAKNKTTSHTPYVPPLIRSTRTSKATQVKAIRAVPVSPTPSVASSSVVQTQQLKRSATAAKFKSTTHISQCSSDFDCGVNQKCVKAPLNSYGTCMTEVNEYNLPTFSGKDTDSILPNLNLNGQCRFNTDCPVSFKCDQELKVCTK